MFFGVEPVEPIGDLMDSMGEVGETEVKRGWRTMWGLVHSVQNG